MRNKKIQEVKLSDLSQEERVKATFELFSSTEASEGIQGKFFDWLSDENLQEMKEEALRQLWDKTDSRAISSTRKSLRKVMKRLEMPESELRKLAPTKTRILLRVAAVLAPLLIIAGYALTLIEKRPDMVVAEVKQLEVYVKNSDRDTILLADGSRAILNAGTHFSYPEQFSPEHDRIVKLEGEGFFDVVKDIHPFIVEAGELTVKVLGTEFNISAYADELEVSVALLSGAVEADITGATMLLKENEKVTYDRKSLAIEHSAIDKSKELAWMTGELIIERKTLSEIFKICERHFGIEIKIDKNISDPTLYSTRFAAEFGIEDILIVLESMTGTFSFDIKDKTILIEMK